MARKAQLMTMAAMTVRSNHFHRMSLHALRLTRDFSWKRYSDVLFSFTRVHHLGSHSMNLVMGPRRSRFFIFSFRALASAAATILMRSSSDGPFFLAGFLTTGIVANDGTRAATPYPPCISRFYRLTPRDVAYTSFYLFDIRRYPARYRATPAPRATAVRNSRDCIHHATGA